MYQKINSPEILYSPRHTTFTLNPWYQFCICSQFKHYHGAVPSTATMHLSLPIFLLPLGTLSNYQNLLLENDGLGGEGCSSMCSKAIWSSVLNTTLVTPLLSHDCSCSEIIRQLFPQNSIVVIKIKIIQFAPVIIFSSRLMCLSHRIKHPH